MPSRAQVPLSQVFTHAQVTKTSGIALPRGGILTGVHAGGAVAAFPHTWTRIYIDSAEGPGIGAGIVLDYGYILYDGTTSIGLTWTGEIPTDPAYPTKVYVTTVNQSGGNINVSLAVYYKT